MVLPEMFNCPYSNESFPKYAEDIDTGSSETAKQLSGFAADNGVTLVAGSIPETSGDKLYNTCLVFDRHGKQLAKHRKVPLGVHLHKLLVTGACRPSWPTHTQPLSCVLALCTHIMLPYAVVKAIHLSCQACKVSRPQCKSVSYSHLGSMTCQLGPTLQPVLGHCKSITFLARELRAEISDRCPRSSLARAAWGRAQHSSCAPHLPLHPSASEAGCCLQIHLFDIDIPGKVTFRESDTLTPGKTITVVDTEHGKLGIGICYDLRFQELAMLYAKRGVQLIIFPGTPACLS